MDEIKIGVIGCGKQAPKHIHGLLRLPSTEIVVCDSNTEAARKTSEQFGVPWLEKPEEIFEDNSVQAVVICTPTLSHIPLIKSSIHHKKAFFCEKPLCEDLASAQEIANLVEQTGITGMVGYVYRYVPIFELGKKLFQDVPQLGESLVLGKPVASFFRLGGRGSHQEWKHQKKSGGGAINEMLVHMVDLAIWYFGEVREATFLARDLLRPTRIIQGNPIQADAEDYVVVRLKMASGVEVLCQADLVTPAFTQLVEIQGDNGTFMGSIQPEMPSFVFCNEPRGGYQQGKTNLNFGMHMVFEAQMAEFIRVVRREIQPRCSIHDSVLLLEALSKLQIKV